MPLDAPASPTANFPRWAEEPPVPPDGSLVPGSRFAEEQWVMAAGMLARGSSFLHVARAMGCSRTTLWRAYYGSQPLRVRVWWERQALNREAELRLSSLRDLVAQQVERLVAMGDPATVRWAADRLGLFAAADASLRPQPETGTGFPQPSDPGAHLSPSSGAGEGFGVTGDRAAPAKTVFGPPAVPLFPAFDDDDAVPGAFREHVLPDPSAIAAILARPEAEGPKGAYPWTFNPDDPYPSLGSAEERRGKGVYRLSGERAG
ncbi:transposase family protein [Azospirillum doebereinerae]|uniref:transposase family protein n=1 Tax=Azospirillum doebereinerae TaxID=92933 RepID=UPI001EE51245|nr:transposase family protein [Azospirillum doebereinerae]MCG5242881.1 transposase family protein [Azospirillum doebereinerae]